MGKSALVTGAGSGIGKAVACALAAEGVRLVLACRDPIEGKRTVEEILDCGGDALFLQTDVRRAEDVSAMVELAEQTYGRLDLAVNNAGVTHPATTLESITDAMFEEVISTNVAGTFFSMRAEIPALRRAGGGSIVNIASVASFTGSPGQGIYSAAKHAIVGLTRTGALENARESIRVNAVAPGVVKTRMFDDFIQASGGDPAIMEAVCNAHPVGRTGLAEEIADAVLFLSSSRSNFITGHTMLVDGGFTAQ